MASPSPVSSSCLLCLLRSPCPPCPPWFGFSMPVVTSASRPVDYRAVTKAQGGQPHADLRATQDVRRAQGGGLGARQTCPGAGRESRPAEYVRGGGGGGDALAAGPG